MRRQPELSDAIPYAFRPVWIVISGKKVPMDIIERLHPFDRRPKRNGVRRFVVVDIAGHENVTGAMRSSQRAEALDSCEPGVP
jgi:hypothetical protein